MKLADLKRKATEAQRRDDTRRKVVLGAAILAAVDRGALRPEAIVRLLDGFLQDRDRALFTSGPLALPSAPSKPEMISDLPSAPSADSPAD